MNESLFRGSNWTLESNVTSPHGQFVNPFDVPFVRITFIVAYVTVFICCCVGNALVLFIILRNARMRTRPYVFLANLAVADLMVGVFCVLPSLTTFLSPVWLLGENMSYMTSILLLTVISMERFVATMLPLKANNLFTPRRLIIAQVTIWLLSCTYNIPHLVVFDLFLVPSPSGGVDKFCFLQQYLINMKTYYTLNIILWYIIPVVVMAIMYTKISVTLWHTSSRKNTLPLSDRGDRGSETKLTKTGEGTHEDQQNSSSADSRSPINQAPFPNRKPTFRVNSCRALRSRRRVIRLLIVILVSFILCVLPHNVRLFLIYWELYPTPSFPVSMFPPIAFLMLYLNSALNPFLYCLLSNTFRRKIKEMSCRCSSKFDSGFK